MVTGPNTGTGGFDPGEKVRRIQASAESPTKALRQVGALLVASSQRAFKEQKWDGKEWEPRGAMNVYGIIADFYEGKRSPPARRFERRPVLRDTGRLASSIAFRVVGNDAVEIGSNLPYASVHQDGGPIESKPITEQVQQLLADWLDGAGSGYRKKLGWLLNAKYRGQTLKGTVPARRFIGVTKALIEDAKEIASVTIFETK